MFFSPHSLVYLCVCGCSFSVFSSIPLYLCVVAVFPMNNHGNYVVRLGEVVRWLSEKAEQLGVDIYPGTPASELVVHPETGAVMGVASTDMGVAKDGSPKVNELPN